MVTKSHDHRTGAEGKGLVQLVGRTVLRSLQMIMAVVLAAIYGIELSAYIAHHNGKPHSAMVFLEVVAGLSIVTAAVLLLPHTKRHAFFAWEAVLFLFWTSLFGTFATMHLHRQCAADDGNCRKMKAAVWIDLLVMLLWFISSVCTFPFETTAVGAGTDSVWAGNGIMYWRDRDSLRSAGRSVVV